MGAWSFVDKAAVGLAVFVGLQGLHAVGYQPNVEQNATVIAGMKFLYCLLPAVFHLVAVLVFQRFPITPEVHTEIRARLEARNGRADALRQPAAAPAPALVGGRGLEPPTNPL